MIVREKSFYVKAASIAVPIAMQSLITIGVNMMDTIMLGTMGETALSASSLANQFISIYQICCMGMGMGASVLTSRYWGKQDLVSLKKAMTIMLRLCIVIATAFAGATLLIPGSLMRLYTKEEAVIREGIRYFNWSILSYYFLGISLTLSLVLRSVGRAKIPLLASIVAFFGNIFFNYMFIFGKFGAPRMEVAGAALGTLIARVVEFAMVAGYTFAKDTQIGYRIRDLFGNCRDLVGEYLKISIPVLVSDSLLALGNSAVAMVMGHIGAQFVSANAITTVTQQLSTVFIQGISQAGCIVIGHTLGMGDRHKAQDQGYTFLLIGLGVGVFAGGLIAAIGGPVISCYRITEETAGIARQLMDAVAFIVVFQSANSILTKGVLRGGGDTKFLMIADILFLWVVSIPVGALAGLYWHLDPFWIYVCLKLDQIIKAVWCVFRLRSKKWIKSI